MNHSNTNRTTRFLQSLLRSRQNLHSQSGSPKRRSRRNRVPNITVAGLQHLEPRILMSASVAGDFNGDGEDDLAIGVPYEDIGSIKDAGAVNVIYGRGGGGLTALKNASSAKSVGELWLWEVAKLVI